MTACVLWFILQADSLPDIPAQTVTEEKYTDEHGNMVTKKVRSIRALDLKPQHYASTSVL